MPRRLGVLAGVAMRRVVATARRAALLARSQVHPLRPDFDAFFALETLRVLDVRDGAEVRAGGFHVSRSPGRWAQSLPHFVHFLVEQVQAIGLTVRVREIVRLAAFDLHTQVLLEIIDRKRLE